jgi:Recombination protein MgsA
LAGRGGAAAVHADELQGREYYHPNDRGYEHEVKPRLERIRKILHEEDDNGDGRSGQRNA